MEAVELRLVNRSSNLESSGILNRTSHDSRAQQPTTDNYATQEFFGGGKERTLYCSPLHSSPEVQHRECGGPNPQPYPPAAPRFRAPGTR